MIVEDFYAITCPKCETLNAVETKEQKTHPNDIHHKCVSCGKFFSFSVTEGKPRITGYER